MISVKEIVPFRIREMFLSIINGTIVYIDKGIQIEFTY